MKFDPVNLLVWCSFFSTLMNCPASALACGFSGVFRWWRKPRYLLKSQKSWLLNGGPLSLVKETGMLSGENVSSIFGITFLALAEVANSTFAHVDCLHTVTNRYSPLWMGPQKATATSFWGHECHAQRLSLMWRSHHLARVAMLNMHLHHFVQPWKPHSGTQVLLGLDDTLVVFVRELDHLIPQSLGYYDSWPSCTSQVGENGAIVRPECCLLLRREVSSSYGFLQVRQFSVWVCFFTQLLPGDSFTHWSLHFSHIFLELFHGLS